MTCVKKRTGENTSVSCVESGEPSQALEPCMPEYGHIHIYGCAPFVGTQAFLVIVFESCQPLRLMFSELEPYEFKATNLFDLRVVGPTPDHGVSEGKNR